MEEIQNFSEPIHILMGAVKKDILSKKANKGANSHNKDIINLLFNLLDYQITLMNQILMFNKTNKENIIDNQKNIDYLIRINKDILVSMINKFVININALFNRISESESKKQILNNRAKNPFDHGKILTQNSTIDNNKNNFLTVDSFTKYNSPIKKNMEKEFNSAISLTQQSSAKKILSFIDPDKNSYKFLRNKNLMFSIKHKPNNDVYDKLYYNKDQRCNHEEKRRNKIMQYQAYSKSMKDIFVDLNDDNSKKIFNKSIRTNTSKGKKRIRDDDL